MRHEIISPTHNLSKYEEHIGSPLFYSEGLQRILYRHVFANVLLDKDTRRSARTDHYL